MTKALLPCSRTENTYLVFDQPPGCDSLNVLGDDVDFNVCVLTATTKCYLMTHVYATPNLPTLDAKSSCPEDTNNANIVSKDTYRNVIKDFRIVPQPID